MWVPVYARSVFCPYSQQQILHSWWLCKVHILTLVRSSFSLIAIKGYNVFHCDHLKKGGGIVLLYKKQISCYHPIITISQQSIKLNLKPYKGHFISRVGYYIFPSANNEALYHWEINYQLYTVFNRNWLSPVSDSLKSTCDSFTLITNE